MVTYENATNPGDIARRRTIWIVTGFVLFLAVLVLLFFAFAGRMERHSYYQPSNQNPPAATNPPGTVGP